MSHNIYLTTFDHRGGFLDVIIGAGVSTISIPNNKKHLFHLHYLYDLLYSRYYFADKIMSDIAMNNVMYGCYFTMKSVIWGIERKNSVRIVNFNCIIWGQNDVDGNWK